MYVLYCLCVHTHTHTQEVFFKAVLIESTFGMTVNSVDSEEDCLC